MIEVISENKEEDELFKCSISFYYPELPRDCVKFL